MRFWPFGNRTKTGQGPVEVTLTDEALDRAIRAGVAFELSWFVQQTPDVQEAIALRRDAWLEDLVVAAGFAVLDPQRTLLGLAAEDGDEDAGDALEDLNAVALAEAVGRRIVQDGSYGEVKPEGLSMGGSGERRRDAEEVREAGKLHPSYFGAEVKN